MRVIDLDEQPDGHAAPITHVAFRPAGGRLVTCSYDGTALVWDTTRPAAPVPLARLRHRRLVNAAAWHPTEPDVLATASADKTVAVWRLTEAGSTRGDATSTGSSTEPGTASHTATLRTVLARHTDDVNAVAWLPDGDRLVCVSEDGRASLWQAGTGALLGEVGAHTAHCMAVSASRHGLVATVGEDGLVAVVEPGGPTGPAHRRYATSVEGCAWSRSGKLLAVARDDGFVDLLTPQLDLVTSVRVADVAARTVDWSDDDASFVVGAYDGALHVFDVSGEPVRTIRDPRLWPRSVAVGQGLLAVGGFGSTPFLFDLATGARLSRPGAPTHGPNALAVADGRLLVGCDSGTVLSLDPDTGADVRASRWGDSPVLCLAARDGAVYAGTYAGQVLSHVDGRLDAVDVGAPVPALCVTDDGLVAGTYTGGLVALDSGPLAVRAAGVPHGGSVKSLAPVPGGFLSASTDRTVAIGTLTDRTPLWAHGNLVNAVATLGGGEVVATASRDHTVTVGRLVRSAGRWRVVRRRTLLGPDESVKCVGLLGDPAAPVVLAGSYDFGLYAWTVDWSEQEATLRTGRLLVTFGQGLSSMVALDADRVAVAGWDGRIVVVGRDDAGEAVVCREFTVADLLTGAVAAPPVGALGERLGRRPARAVDLGAGPPGGAVGVAGAVGPARERRTVGVDQRRHGDGSSR
ncbi:repetative protein [Micromonospora wenchangensis]|uniref:WD40 repeat domain-containing protein n=1 Tax=Micromonospora wenchangensis TaxID=1185415 RepID=UPI003D75EA02